jgi:hypothetical protein
MGKLRARRAAAGKPKIGSAFGKIAQGIVGELPIVGGAASAAIDVARDAKERKMAAKSTSRSAPLDLGQGGTTSGDTTMTESSQNKNNMSGSCGCQTGIEQPEGYYGCKKAYTCAERCAYGEMMREKCTGCTGGSRRSYTPRRSYSSSKSRKYTPSRYGTNCNSSSKPIAYSDLSFGTDSANKPKFDYTGASGAQQSAPLVAKRKPLGSLGNKPKKSRGNDLGVSFTEGTFQTADEDMDDL